MSFFQIASLRRLWLNVHLWIALGLAVLLIPISISGALLVWHDDLDALLNPSRYAVSGAQPALPLSTYLDNAAKAVADDPSDLRPMSLRFGEDGGPIRVMARAHNVEQGKRPALITVYLDPPTGKVLDSVNFRASLFGFLHVFHENLTVPDYSGRQIVGWAGVGMLILSLTGIYLWWPSLGFLRGFRWKRSNRITFNLHHMIGIWIAVPLAVVSATGIYLAFPQTARETMSAVAGMNPQGPRGFGGQVMKTPALSAERALDAATTKEPSARPVAIFLPTQQRGEGGRGPAWRVQLESGGHALNVMVDDRTGAAASLPAPQAGDRAASWIRWIHEGSHSGPVWAFLVFLTGVAPTVFAVTGIMMWLRRPSGRRSPSRRRGGAESLHAAE